MHKYRRTRGGWGFKKWHSSPQCRNWPRGNYEERPYPPGSGVCSNCMHINNQRGFNSPWRI